MQKPKSNNSQLPEIVSQNFIFRILTEHQPVVTSQFGKTVILTNKLTKPVITLLKNIFIQSMVHDFKSWPKEKE